MSLLALDDGNQTELQIAPTVERSVLDRIASTYKWSRFDLYDNRMWEYMYALHDPVVREAYSEGREALWLKLTREQKVFYAFLTFAGETDNGGVWQFLFNCPDLAIAALEAFEEVQAERLAGDYRATLEEVVGKAESIADLRRRAHKCGPTAEKWAAFVEGYSQLQTPKRIEDYFYSKGFKKELYRQMCNYVESRFDRFARIRESTGA